MKVRDGSSEAIIKGYQLSQSHDVSAHHRIWGGQRRLKEAITRGPRPQSVIGSFLSLTDSLGTGPGESTSRSVPQVCSPEPDSGDAEDPLVTQGMTRPASQAQGERRARKRDWTESVRETLLAGIVSN